MRFIKIDIGGQERTIRFGLKVIGDCIEHYDNDPIQFFKGISGNAFHAIPLIIWYGTKYHLEKNGELVKHTVNDVYEWVEDKGLDHDDITQVTQRFIRSLYDNVPLIKELIDKQPEDVKKNLIGT